MGNQSPTLTKSQKRWCEMVNAGMSGADACQKIRPKLTRGSAKTKAYELRKLPHIQAYLAELDSRAVEEAGVTRTFVLDELKKVAGTEMTEHLASKVGALRELAGILGMRKDQLEISTVVRVIDMTGKKDETPSNG